VCGEIAAGLLLDPSGPGRHCPVHHGHPALARILDGLGLRRTRIGALTTTAGREAWAIGFLMNTRGLMELVAANIGLDLGIVPASVFFIMVFMALVTPYMTPPLVRHVLRPTLTTA
jgi:Kef-type K+ transport system membrane component KefB